MKIAKKSKSKSDVPSAITGPVGGAVPSAKTGEKLGGDIGTTLSVKASELQVANILRSAKKAPVEEAQAPKKKLEGEVSLGPTETQEISDRKDYEARLKKRGK